MIRLVRGGTLAGGGGMERGEVHGVLSRVMDGSEHPFGSSYELIERTMLKGPWVMGDTYTVADGYLFTLANWLEGDGVDLKRFPRVTEHRARIAERPATKRALAQELG